MKDDHWQDFINERQESFKWCFAFLSPKFYRTTDTLTGSLNRSFLDKNALQDELLWLLEFFAVHSQKNLAYSTQ